MHGLHDLIYQAGRKVRTKRDQKHCTISASELWPETGFWKVTMARNS